METFQQFGDSLETKTRQFYSFITGFDSPFSEQRYKTIILEQLKTLQFRYINMASLEGFYELPFHLLQLPQLKLKKPTWLKAPSSMFVFALVLVSYFLVTGGNYQ